MEDICCHLWLHYPSTSASPFPNSYNLFKTKNEQLDVDFEESGSQSLLVIVASEKYASFNYGKEIFCCGK